MSMLGCSRRQAHCLQQRPCGSSSYAPNKGMRAAQLRRTSLAATPPQIQASASPQLQRILRKAKTVEELNDPAQIGTTGTATSTFKIQPNYEPLQSYMTLPVEQYFVLDPKQIAHLGGNQFILTVPRINIFNIWLEAVVEVRVTTYPMPSPGGSPPRVVLQAENCRITGSDAVESLRLDQRFCMRFSTELTWFEARPMAPRAGAGGPSHLAGGGSVGEGEIRASSQLDVWSEVVPPFHLLPREVLVASCNGVLKGLMSSLLPLFVRLLATDYQRWAQDPAYRAERATRSKPLA